MKIVRVLTFITGFLTFAWQVLQVIQGNGKNLFLVPDIILGILLVAVAFLKPTVDNEKWLIAALSYACGVFATATFGGLVMDTYDFGAFTTTVGLVLCLLSIIWLIRKHKLSQ